jgi:hypothetical protein
MPLLFCSCYSHGPALIRNSRGHVSWASVVRRNQGNIYVIMLKICLTVLAYAVLFGDVQSQVIYLAAITKDSILQVDLKKDGIKYYAVRVINNVNMNSN